MKFHYHSAIERNVITGEKDIVYRPYIPIDIGFRGKWLSEITNGYFKTVDALIDTGADNNLCPIGLAKMLNIDFKAARSSKIQGINGQIINCHFVPISVRLGDHIFDSTMGFGDTIRAVVLGGQGFLDKCKVTFEYAKEIEIIMTSSARM